MVLRKEADLPRAFGRTGAIVFFLLAFGAAGQAKKTAAGRSARGVEFFPEHLPNLKPEPAPAMAALPAKTPVRWWRKLLGMQPSAQTAGPSSLARQPAAMGSTPYGAIYDPTRPGNPVVVPQMPVRNHTAVPLEEYLQRKAVAEARRPIITGPPGLILSDYTQARAPIFEPRQPLGLTATVNFEGIAQQLAPPDPDLAAGPEDLIAVINSQIARYSKTGVQSNLQSLQQWFSNLVPTVCTIGSCAIFDPKILYDSLHGRFLLSAISLDTATRKTYFLISVSNGSTFAGGWKNWALEGSVNGTTQTNFEIDFTQLGYDSNAVYLCTDMLTVFLDTFQYAKVRILKKSELYNPATTTLTFQDIWDLRNEDNSKAAHIQPTILRGRPGSATSPGILVNTATTANADYLTVWRINDPTGSAPTAVRTTIRGVWPYDVPASIPQLGTAVRLDSGFSAVLKAVVRNGVLFTARNSGYTTEPTTVTYDRIDLATNKVTLQGRLSNGNYFYPAFDVPASNGPGNAFPNKLITGTTTDSTGSLTYAGITEVKAGEDWYIIGDRQRWGDYFGASLDPILGGMWVYGQYAKPRVSGLGVYGTRAAYFPVATSPQFTDVSSSSVFYDAINTLRMWSITLGCTATTFCPGNPVLRSQAAAFVIRALLGDTFTFPATPYFTDVPSTHQFFPQIQKMRELGIASGCTATTFCPDAPITRTEMAIFLVRGKLRALLGDDFSFPQTAYFNDVPSTHPSFKFIQKLRELGVTLGCGSGAGFCPDDIVTREQMATFLYRAFLN
jgi:hypothetical protein